MVSVHVRVLLINGGSKQPDVACKGPDAAGRAEIGVADAAGVACIAC